LLKAIDDLRKLSGGVLLSNLSEVGFFGVGFSLLTLFRSLGAFTLACRFWFLLLL
tara:strand:- start:9332 stop:9496 length:165 start_codon:yes stop_codon:yes gene_type:complete